MTFTKSIVTGPDRDTRHRLIDAARSTLAEVGIERLSMRAIAAAAGVTPGAIYRHFPDRDRLVDAVVADALKELEMHLLRSIASLPVGSYERVKELGRQYINLALATPDYFTILFFPKSSVKRRIGDLPGSAGFDLLTQCVEECMEAGVLKRAQARTVALMLWTRVHGIVSFFATFDLAKDFPEFSQADGALAFFEATQASVLDGIRGRRR